MKTFSPKSFFTFFIPLIAGSLVVSDVFAASTPVAGGLGSSMVNATTSHTSINTLLSIVSYVVGVTLCVMALVRFKAWGDGQTTFMDGLWRLVGGTFLVGLPDVIIKIENSLFKGNGAWTGASSTSGAMDRTSTLPAVTAGNGTLSGLDTVMIHFISDIYTPAKSVISMAGWILGLTCMITGIYRLAQAGQTAHGKAPSGKGTAGYILGGALLLAGGNLMDSISITLVGSNFSTLAFTTLANTLPANSDAVNNVIKAMFAFVEIVGWIAFVRGIFLLVKLAQGGHERSHAHAFSHILFGVALVNMYAVVVMIQTTLGVNLVQTN